MTHRSDRSLSRRQWIGHAAGLGAAMFAPCLLAQPDDAVRLGQSVALTGPLGELGKAMSQGAQAGFAAANARGGVNGRRIELVVRDDGYDVKRSQENLRGFLADPGLFGLFGCMGTPMIEALLPLIRSTDVPCFAPLTGATSARPADMRNVFNVRASYPEETERLVQHLATIGLNRIAVVHQNNSFGKEVAQAADAAIAKYGLRAVATASVENSGANARDAAQRIAASEREAVLIGLAGKPTIDFVKSMRSLRRGLPLYALSVMGSAATLNALGDDAYGIAVTQVVPLPSNSVVPVVRDFLAAWQASGATLAPSHLALEGYINARIFIDALRRLGRDVKRSAFIESTWSLKRLDLGGFDVSFDKPGRNASRFIELTLIGRGGRFVR
jgi:branched-chain amino acid transport system substrate-binding protein